MKSRTRKQLPALDDGLGERLKMTEWRKHYVSSVTAEEDAWPQREPGSNLGRIFVLLLLLHVFIIGAVVLYNIISPKAPLVARTDPKPTITGTMSAASMVNTDTTTTSAPVSPTPPKTNNTVVKPVVSTPTPEPAKSRPAPAADPKPADDGILTYDVKSGDNVPAIAATLGVNPEDLVKMNDLADSDLYPGRKLKYHRPASGSGIVVASASPAPVLKPQTTKETTNHNFVVNPAPVTPATPKQTKPVVMKADREKNPHSIPTAAKIEDSASDRSADSVPHAVPVPSTANVEDQPPPAKPKVKSNSADSPPAAKPKSETKHKDKDKDRDKSDEPKSKKSKADRDRDEPSTKSKSEKNSKESAHKRTHIVGPHETIYSISRKFGVSVGALERANNIKDPTHIRDGSKIIIPSKANAD